MPNFNRYLDLKFKFEEPVPLSRLIDVASDARRFYGMEPISVGTKRGIIPMYFWTDRAILLPKETIHWKYSTILHLISHSILHTHYTDGNGVYQGPTLLHDGAFGRVFIDLISEYFNLHKQEVEDTFGHARLPYAGRLNPDMPLPFPGADINEDLMYTAFHSEGLLF